MKFGKGEDKMELLKLGTKVRSAKRIDYKEPLPKVGYIVSEGEPFLNNKGETDILYIVQWENEKKETTESFRNLIELQSLFMAKYGLSLDYFKKFLKLFLTNSKFCVKLLT